MTELSPADLVREYRAGRTIEDLAAESQLSYRCVRGTLIALGVELRPPMRQMPPCPPGMVQAYNFGDSIRTLAARYGLSYNQTRNLLLHKGVTLRRQGQPPGGFTTTIRS